MIFSRTNVTPLELQAHHRLDQIYLAYLQSLETKMNFLEDFEHKILDREGYPSPTDDSLKLHHNKSFL